MYADPKRIRDNRVTIRLLAASEFKKCLLSIAASAVSHHAGPAVWQPRVGPTDISFMT